MDHFLISLLAGVSEVVTVPDNEPTLLWTLDFFFFFFCDKAEKGSSGQKLSSGRQLQALILCAKCIT